MFFIGGNDGSEPVAMISESYSFSIISSFSSFAVIVLFFISMDVIVVFKWRFIFAFKNHSSVNSIRCVGVGIIPDIA